MLLEGVDSHPRDPDPVHLYWHFWGWETVFLISPIPPLGTPFSFVKVELSAALTALLGSYWNYARDLCRSLFY